MSTLKQLLASRTPESRRRIEEMAEEMLFEAHLHQLREALNISQQELAKTLGISQPSVAAIEGRAEDFDPETLRGSDGRHAAPGR